VLQLLDEGSFGDSQQAGVGSPGRTLVGQDAAVVDEKRSDNDISMVQLQIVKGTRRISPADTAHAPLFPSQAVIEPEDGVVHVVRAGPRRHELEQLAEVQRVVAPDPDRARHEDEDAARGGAGLDVGRRHRVDDLPHPSQLLQDGVAALELLPLERHHGAVRLTDAARQRRCKVDRCAFRQAEKEEQGRNCTVVRREPRGSGETKTAGAHDSARTKSEPSESTLESKLW
jgi:hypothetical protein